MKTPTIGVRGLCFTNNKWLVVRHKTPKKDFWTLPGGLVEKETLEEAIKREMQEETHLTVTEATMVAVGELIKEQRHTIDVFFFVNAEGKAKLGKDPELEGQQQKLAAIAWKTLEELQTLAKKHQFLPGEILPVLKALEQNNQGFWYLGEYHEIKQ